MFFNRLSTRHSIHVQLSLRPLTDYEVEVNSVKLSISCQLFMCFGQFFVVAMAYFE